MRCASVMLKESDNLSAQPLLKLQGIRKTFPGVTALDGIDFDVHSSEVHALVGENGAGKSTLIKIIAGVHQPDAGTITWRGERVHIRDPQHAQSLGIAVIYQEPALCPDLSVVENILLGRLPCKCGIVQWGLARDIVTALFSELGVEIPLDALIMDLTPAQRQIVEIAKALSQNAQLLIMDEPTSALSETETERLFGIVKRLCERDVAVIYISHRLDEVFAIANRVTVLRDGHKMGTFNIHEVDHNKLVQLMVGRPLDQYYARPAGQRGVPLLTVRNLSLRNRFTDVSFTVHAGEVVGLAGLMGAGRSSIAQALFGIAPADEGEIEWQGEPIQIQTPADAMRVGIVYLPEDRQRQALVLPMSVRENLSLAILRQLARTGFVQRYAEEALAHEFVQRLRVQPPRI
ncbi:MAG TPA: sugar ABC transporter ATP-binding protein, partial [Armatimonadetes bacterium]|nr:sugar ABC transporter ATP-binding protein [Armatimonadota bacterium]